MLASRRAIFLGGIGFLLFPAIPAKAADISKEAQKLIDTLGTQAISILSEDIGEAARLEKFTRLLVGGFDIPAIARFCLGRYWRTASDEQKATYQAAFQAMVISVYASRFREYRGVQFRVTNTHKEGEDHALVTSSLQYPNSSQSAKVEWRVLRPQGQAKVVDVIVEGVSMSLTQQQDFAAALQGNGGNLDAFILELKRRSQP